MTEPAPSPAAEPPAPGEPPAPAPDAAARADVRGLGPSPAILLVEDSPTVALLIEQYLVKGFGEPVEVVGFERVEPAIRASLERDVHCLLLDLSLPDSAGLSGLRRVLEAVPHVPVVVLTGTDSEEMAVSALKAGAQDYLIKGQVDAQSLARSIRYAIERGRIERELEGRVLRDPLTGLANRALFEDRLRQAIARSESSGLSFALLFFDLNDFKRINDTLGHAAGDQTLLEVAARATDAVRPQDTVARFGGDEFAVLCERLSGSADAVIPAERVVAAVCESPVVIDGRDIRVDLALGIATGDGASDAGSLTREADAAMYRAKDRGIRRERFAPATKENEERLELEAGLRGALADGQLVLHYQPLVRLVDERLLGVEALVRWDHPKRGLVPPLSFIPIAEELGLIGQLGHWVLREACLQLRSWSHDYATEDLILSVNVSPVELADPDLPGGVERILAETGMPADRLCLELTERQLVRDTEQAERQLSSLQQAGVRVAIDDFGTGYSSLDLLARLPFDFVKIDRSLISGLDRNQRKMRLLQGLCGMIGALDTQPIAEGLERSEEAGLLRDLGCTIGQGYLFGRPQPAADVVARLGTRP